MLLKQTLKHHPTDYIYNEAYASYAQGKPLRPDLLNFFYRHSGEMTDHRFTPIKNYYLRKQAEEHTFLLPHEKLNASSIQELKRRLQILLREKNASLQFKMKPEQFLQLRAMTVDELVLYHGNQFLTGAPFYQGGVPHTLFFQWGNLFGVAKYVVLPEERALRSNVLIYLENMHERYLDQCVNEYKHKIQETLPSPVQEMAPTIPAYVSKFSIPTLTLSRNNTLPDET
jgi:hypothetical protein